MLYSGLILAAVLPLIFCDEARASDIKLEGSISYASYHAEWGEKMTFPIARSIHLELSRERLNASLTGGIPSLSYAGPVDKMTFKELANLLCSMDAASWPGSTGDDNQGKRRKDQCEWDLCILVKEPAQQRIRVYGADKGRSTPRLEAEAKLCAYLKKS